MQIGIQLIPVRVPLIFCCLMLVASCDNGDQSASIGSDNAPAFGTEGLETTSSPMARLSYQLALLDRELVEDEYNVTEQPEVVAILTEMEAITNSLMAENAGESHAFLQEDLADFSELLGTARQSAESSPPRYYLAGRIAGGCINCHEVSL